MTAPRFASRQSARFCALLMFVAGLLAPLLLAACANPATSAAANSDNQSQGQSQSDSDNVVLGDDLSLPPVAVIGALHGTHRSSSAYSLPVIAAAIRRFNPDYVLIELPAEELARAQAQWQQGRRFTAGRVLAFPELTDVLFPLAEKLDFTMLPVAAWSPAIAAQRREKEAGFAADPRYAAQWREHLAARRAMNRALGGRFDDPAFIHSDAYDAIIADGHAPIERHFDALTGAAGWGRINAAHIALMNAALDRIVADHAAQTGKASPPHILILFGAWHKYKIRAALAKRSDVRAIDSAKLFASSE